MYMINSKNLLQIWQISKINMKHNSIHHFGLAVVIIILTPLLFDITNLDIIASATPLEMLVSLIGIVLITPIFQPEQNYEIGDVIESKYISLIYVCIIRIIYSLISMVLIIAAFIAFMKLYGCSINLVLMFGTISDAMFLGSLGIITSAITNNIVVSYMIPLIYYILNFSGVDLGSLYLFSMIGGIYTPKIWMFVISVVLIILAILIKWISKKYI